MVHIFSNFQGTYNVSQRNINPLPLWKSSLVFDNSQEYITMQKKLQVNTGIYPTQYMAPNNLQAKETASKNSANCATKKVRKITKPSLVTLASPFDRFNKTRANARTIIDYFSPSILSPFPLEITTTTRYLEYIMIQ